jgi:shikimate kinase
MCITKAQKEHLLKVLRIAHEDNDVFTENNESYHEQEALKQCQLHEQWIDEAIEIVNSLRCSEK